MDDGTIGGTAEELMANFNTIVTDGLKLDLVLMFLGSSPAMGVRKLLLGLKLGAVFS